MQWRVAIVSAALLTTVVGGVPASADDGRQSDPAAEQVSTLQAQQVSPIQAQQVTNVAAKPTWRPHRGPAFNNPYGGEQDRFRLERRILEAIRHTPDDGQLRFSIYSFDRMDMAKALVNARQRGVQVQVLLNDHQVTRAQRLLHRKIGHDPTKKNFVYECVASCRGRRDNLHTKFYLFSKTGASENVIMTGSANLTLNAVKWQWNDLYTMRNKPRLWSDFENLFNRMRHDYSTNRPYYTFCGAAQGKTCNRLTSPVYNQVFPVKVSKDDDPVMDILNSVRCVVDGKRTKVRLSMHTMRGPRAEYIADRLRTMWARGCDIKVLYGLMGFPVKRHIGANTSRGRIPLRSTGYDYNGDGDVDRYTHQKYLTIRGYWGGDKDAAVTFTGSSNWTNKGTGGDEIVFNMHGPGNVAKYNANWDFMWNNHSRNAYTTTASEYETVVPVWRGDVLTHEVITRRVVTTTVEPDRLSAGSPTFESD